MSSPPPPRPSSHRAGSPRWHGAGRPRRNGPGGLAAAALSRRALPPLAAVTAVVGVIALLLVLNNRPSPPGPAPGAVAENPASAHISTAPPVAPSAAVSAPPVSEPPATQSPAPVEAPRLPVTVLNNSRIAHLAARVAADLRAHGWPVRSTGNFTGRVKTTTIYFGPGQRASAQRLAREFGQVRRVERRFRGLPGSGLTLVVTRDWSS